MLLCLLFIAYQFNFCVVVKVVNVHELFCLFIGKAAVHTEVVNPKAVLAEILADAVFDAMCHIV